MVWQDEAMACQKKAQILTYSVSILIINKITYTHYTFYFTIMKYKAVPLT